MSQEEAVGEGDKRQADELSCRAEGSSQTAGIAARRRRMGTTEDKTAEIPVLDFR